MYESCLLLKKGNSLGLHIVHFDQFNTPPETPPPVDPFSPLSVDFLSNPKRLPIKAYGD